MSHRALLLGNYVNRKNNQVNPLGWISDVYCSFQRSKWLIFQNIKVIPHVIEYVGSSSSVPPLYSLLRQPLYWSSSWSVGTLLVGCSRRWWSSIFTFLRRRLMGFDTSWYLWCHNRWLLGDPSWLAESVGFRYVLGLLRWSRLENCSCSDSRWYCGTLGGRHT